MQNFLQVRVCKTCLPWDTSKPTACVQLKIFLRFLRQFLTPTGVHSFYRLGFKTFLQNSITQFWLSHLGFSPRPKRSCFSLCLRLTLGICLECQLGWKSWDQNTFDSCRVIPSLLPPRCCRFQAGLAHAVRI